MILLGSRPSRDELRGIVSSGDSGSLIELFFAVSAEYRTGNAWAVTTVVYAVDRAWVEGGGSFQLWDSAKNSNFRDSASLRILNLHTTAT
jgi:hypothetical protein